MYGERLQLSVIWWMGIGKCDNEYGVRILKWIYADESSLIDIDFYLNHGILCFPISEHVLEKRT